MLIMLRPRWHTIDVENRRYLLGDKFGRLSMLFLSDVPKLTLVPLGEVGQMDAVPDLSLIEVVIDFATNHHHVSLEPSALYRITSWTVTTHTTTSGDH